MKDGTRDKDPLEFEITGFEPLVPDGIYIVRFIEHITHPDYRGRPRLYLYFQIMDGPHEGETLRFHSGVKSLKKPYGKSGGFKLGSSSKLTTQFFGMIGMDVEDRNKPSLGKLQGKDIVVRVETVDKNADKTPKHKSLQYSKISHLIGFRDFVIPTDVCFEEYHNWDI